MTIKLILSEGPHDAAFLKRIFMAFNLQECKLKIAEYPDPFSNYIKSLFNASQFEGSTILRTRLGFFFPTDALSKGDEEIIVLFTTGGKDKAAIRQQVVQDFYALLNSEVAQKQVNDLKVKIVFNMDVDNGDVSDCEQMVHKELINILPNIPEIKNMHWVNWGNITFGLYAFMNPKTGKGRLEDMVLPLIKEKNPELFDHASQYLNRASVLERPNGNGFLKDLDKAHIGVLGQLYQSGYANTTIIEKTPLIDDQMIKEEPVYQDLVSFFFS